MDDKMRMAPANKNNEMEKKESVDASKAQGMIYDRVLCASNAYEKKFYLNPKFASLPSQVQDELKITCVMFTEEVGGILTMIFDDDGSLYLYPDHDESDVFYDEIGCGLLVKKIQRDKEELFEAVENYYKSLE